MASSLIYKPIPLASVTYVNISLSSKNLKYSHAHNFDILKILFLIYSGPYLLPSNRSQLRSANLLPKFVAAVGTEERLKGIFYKLFYLKNKRGITELFITNKNSTVNN
jgi:hypothetical protein